MISLTRKIRRHYRPAQQKCPDRTRYLMKYFRYAGGEILLVVLGILIAFQVNAWNLARENREIEKKLLERIRADLQNDISEYRSVKEFKAWQNDACLWLLEYFIDPSLPVTDTARFLNELNLTFYFILPSSNITSFEIATSTGQLTKITNDSLVSDLSVYFCDDKLEQHVTETKRYTNSFVENNLVRQYPLFSKYVKLLDGQGETYVPERYVNDLRPVLPIDKLRSDVAMENHLNLLSIRLTIGIKGLEKEEAWARSLIKAIETHIDAL